ncbi:hypothetical protein Q8A67_004311 [Cirrhinus molitorella]|uniref:Immunoglobulin V-set domain-containing protein n=1 Tax=Cirrhinus molitorella TaxID=172907 RepID=A0AA88Q227_9TELE|nr:hypothetical protein Q8A67_004311 [Cirrhinus molitorella]
MLLSTCSCSDHADINVKAIAGQATSLPCKCPPNSPLYLVWQKVIGEQELVVNYYNDDDKEDKQTSPEYRNRTELKLTGNCSLVFHRVRLSDRGLYKCYYRTAPLRHDRIHLDVTARRDIPEPEPDPDRSVQSTIVTSSVCGFLIVIAVAAVYVGITCRNRQRRTFIATSMGSI